MRLSSPAYIACHPILCSVNNCRREAYTCWSTSSGAEEFNFGSRIDHILIAGPCLHENQNECHSFVNCHVEECDILEQFKRWKPGNTPR